MKANSLRSKIFNLAQDGKTYETLTLQEKIVLTIDKIIELNDSPIKETPDAYAVTGCLKLLEQEFDFMVACVKQAANDIDNQEYIEHV